MLHVTEELPWELFVQAGPDGEFWILAYYVQGYIIWFHVHILRKLMLLYQDHVEPNIDVISDYSLKFFSNQWYKLLWNFII